MRIFVTGATGFIGSHVVPELLSHGHSVLGMTRSDEGGEKLRSAGADVHRGELSDLESLSSGAAQADGVIHLAFDHDFSNFLANTEKDRHAIDALASSLIGTGKPLVITSGVGLGSQGPGKLADEDVYDEHHGNPRKASEEAGRAALAQGVNVSVVRLPQVHDRRKQGLITPYIALTRENGVVAYVGDGSNRWSAAHVSDVARLYRLVVEKAVPGSRYNAVGEEGVAMRDVAETLAKVLNLPARSLQGDEVAAHFGWMTMFAGMDLAASSAKTQQRLDWKPSGPGLLEDLSNLSE